MFRIAGIRKFPTPRRLVRQLVCRPRYTGRVCGTRSGTSTRTAKSVPRAFQERSKSYPDKKLKDARAFLAKVETDKLTGDYIDPEAGKTTLREYGDNWLKGQSQDESSQRTMRSKLDKQVYPFLGARALSTISATTIRDWLSWINGKNVSESHKSQVFDLLSAVLSSAVDEKKIRTNP
jgi:hypothetical protein